MQMIGKKKLPILARAEKYGCVGDAEKARVFFASLTDEEKEALSKEIQTVIEPIKKALQPFIDFASKIQEILIWQ